jgi:hypothetical protein
MASAPQPALQRETLAMHESPSLPLLIALACSFVWNWHDPGTGQGGPDHYQDRIRHHGLTTYEEH